MLTPLAKSDWVTAIVAGVMLAATALYVGWWPVAIVVVVLAAGFVALYRDPKRRSPMDRHVFVAPIDGRLLPEPASPAAVTRPARSTASTSATSASSPGSGPSEDATPASDAPAAATTSRAHDSEKEAASHDDAGGLRFRIRNGLLAVHVLRSPCHARVSIEDLDDGGRRITLSHPTRQHALGELTLHGRHGISPILAIKPKQILQRGQRFGFVPFGGEVELTAPASIEPKRQALRGQARVTGGVTLLARITPPPGEMQIVHPDVSSTPARRQDVGGETEADAAVQGGHAEGSRTSLDEAARGGAASLFQTPAGDSKPNPG